MTLLERFLDPAHTSLKVCGVTRRDDALDLVRLGVDAIGANFWPHSKRHIAPRDAAWLGEISGRILRVGVFVNQPVEESLTLWHDGLIDVIQLHGDEGPAHRDSLVENGAPFFQALAILPDGTPASGFPTGAAAVLLDAHAPGVYGGTGRTIDWTAARTLRDAHPEMPVILAGGITPENAAAATTAVRPAALDTASGVESAPGIKNAAKISALLAALRSVC
jgi:phosphoribosylanthranilate isomerase